MARSVSVGQIEAAACELLIGFQRRAIGRGPKWVTASFRSNALLVLLRGVLTPAEATLAGTSSPDHGRSESLVRQMRDRLVHQEQGLLLAAVAELVDHPAEGIHMLHDLNPEANEEVFVFSLDVATPTSRPRHGEAASGSRPDPAHGLGWHAPPAADP